VAAADGACADNDVLIGQCYERCAQNGATLRSIEFNDTCGEYTSVSMSVECCASSVVEPDQPDAGGGTGGTGSGTGGFAGEPS
jgi:hypothetical protein